MIERVYTQCIKSDLTQVVVATDDSRILNHVNTFGKVVMTSAHHQSGTDRCNEVAEKLHEELLIGLDSRATIHPRIRAANESRQPPEELFAAIEQLALACDSNDILQIHKIMIEQQTAYKPSIDIADQFWIAAASDSLKTAGKTPAEPPRLSLVRS